MIYYVQIEKDTNKVVGYSSSKMYDEDLEFEDELLDERFKGSPFFYIYNVEKKTLDYSEDLYNEYLKKKNEASKNPEDTLFKEVANSKVALMQQQNINKTILQEAAKSKVEAINQHEINKSLLKEIADIKINSMKGGN